MGDEFQDVQKRSIYVHKRTYLGVKLVFYH